MAEEAGRGRLGRLARTWRAGVDACIRRGPRAVLRGIVKDPMRAVAMLRGVDAGTFLINRQYQAWLNQRRLTPSAVQAMQADVRSLAYQPLVSILMPVYNTGEEWLQAAIESVRGQAYHRWELCVVDDASTAPHIPALLQAAAAGDPRIKVRRLEANEGISGASNHALGLATGEFVGLLDHDDTLTPDALVEVVRRLNEDRSLDLIYSDHDIRDTRGRRINPFFKPDWSPDLLLSMNYITHFCVYRRELLTRIGGFRKGFEGSQDYDLLLRATEQTSRIAHIPVPLYSWGQAPASVAADPAAKPYAHEAGRRALRDALSRREIPGDVLDGYGAPFRYRVRRTIQGHPSVSIIIPSRDNWQLLDRCVRSLQDRGSYQPIEIVVVDNQSRQPETLEYLKHVPATVVSFPEVFNYAKMNNRGAAAASGEYLVFLNDDTEVLEPAWLEAMLEHAQRPEVGAVGARLLFMNGSIQHAGVLVGIQGKAGHAFWGLPGTHPGYYDFARVIRNYSAVTAACLMMRRSVFEEVGGFDEAFEVSYNDVDLCLRLRERGYLIVYTPYATLYHHQSASRGPYDAEKDRKYEDLFRQRWKKLLEVGDPYYSPHLTRTGFDFSLRVN